MRLFIVIPAQNEEALIGEALEAILASVARASGVSRHELWLPETFFEVIVADDGSEDAPAAIVGSFAQAVGVRWVPCMGRSCAAARNVGAAASSGRVLCFVDADTIVPAAAVDRILELHEHEGRCLVLYRLASRESGLRARLWWCFWGLARRLPLAKAKSMPAFMSCDRAHLQPANGAPALWIRSDIPEVGLGGPLPLGANLAQRSDPARERQSMMQERTVVLILGAVAFSVVGQLFLRSGAQLLAWLGSTVCWLYVLLVAPLSRAYGLTSLSYVLILAASVYLFGEQVGLLHVVGTLLIVVGIACLLYGD